MFLKFYYVISLLTFISFYLVIHRCINITKSKFANNIEILEQFMRKQNSTWITKLQTLIKTIILCMCPIVHLFILYIFTFESKTMEKEIVERAVKKINESNCN